MPSRALKARRVSRKGTRTAKRSARKSARTAKKTARRTTKSARKASRKQRKTTRKRKTQSAPTYKKTRNKVHITERGAAKIKKNGKWVYVTSLLAAGAAGIGAGGYLYLKRFNEAKFEQQENLLIHLKNIIDVKQWFESHQDHVTKFYEQRQTNSKLTPLDYYKKHKVTPKSQQQSI